MKRFLVAIAIALLFINGSVAIAEQITIPSLSRAVTDIAGALSSTDRDALESQLRNFSAQKGSQIAILILPTTGEETIEQFGIRLADAWKIGRRGIDDGVIMIVATKDRAIRIEVGRGFEGALTDIAAKRIIEDIVIPHFREGNMPAGIEAGANAIISIAKGESLPAPSPKNTSDGSTFNFVLTAFMIGLFIGSFLKSAFGTHLGALTGAVITFFVGLSSIALFGSLLIAVLVFIILLQSGIAGVPMYGGRGRGPWGGGGGGFGGGFSGGGFSGGGGSFGGGGASGRW